MKIAISIWNKSVSNVFDFSTELLLLEFDNSQEISRASVELSEQSLVHKANKLRSLGVDVLICGAISREMLCSISDSKIEVLSYVTGSIDDVLDAYLGGELDAAKFIMPGCWSGARDGFGNCKRLRQRRNKCNKRWLDTKGN